MLGKEFDRELEKFVENELLEEIKKEALAERRRQRGSLVFNVFVSTCFVYNIVAACNYIRKNK